MGITQDSTMANLKAETGQASYALTKRFSMSSLQQCNCSFSNLGSPGVRGRNTMPGASGNGKPSAHKEMFQ
jgi:hypothetical protein